MSSNLSTNHRRATRRVLARLLREYTQATRDKINAAMEDLTPHLRPDTPPAKSQAPFPIFSGPEGLQAEVLTGGIAITDSKGATIYVTANDIPALLGAVQQAHDNRNKF